MLQNMALFRFDPLSSTSIRRRADEEKEESEASQGEEEEGQEEKNKDESEKQPAWFDAETKTRKAERTYVQQMKNLRTDLDKVNDLMTQVLTEFRSKPDDAQEFSQEMTLVQKRQEWLVAALSQDDSALNGKISEQEAASRTPSDGATVTDSRDGGALARAGPCAGFENLKSLNFLESQAPKFRACSSQADIKQTMESITPSKKLIMMLASACKTAVNELVGAKKKSLQNKEKQKEKDLKEAADKRKKNAGGPC